MLLFAQGRGALANHHYLACDPNQLQPVVEVVFAGGFGYHAGGLNPFGCNAIGMIEVFMGHDRVMIINLVFEAVLDA